MSWREAATGAGSPGVTTADAACRGGRYGRHGMLLERGNELCIGRRRMSDKWQADRRHRIGYWHPSRREVGGAIKIILWAWRKR